MRSKAANSPDYEGMSPQEALADLRQRIANYENAYETVSNVRLSYIKLYDLSSRVLANKIYGRLATSLVPYLMSVHIGTRPIWLVRAGASRFSLLSTIPLVSPAVGSLPPRFWLSAGLFCRRGVYAGLP